MGLRGELFTTEVYLENRSYFFNVKENRTGDVFLQIVEAKSRDGMDGDRHQIAVFADDMQKFFQGMERSLAFIEKDRQIKAKAKAERKAEKEKRVYKMKSPDARKSDGIKRTGRVHVVSKRTQADAGAERSLDASES